MVKKAKILGLLLVSTLLLTGVRAKSLTLLRVISLGAVDAINPCALAVLALVLMSILTSQLHKKKIDEDEFEEIRRGSVLKTGLAFSTSIFITYLFYGLVLVKFFQVMQVLTSIRLWLYRILGIIAIIIGLLNIKDFFWYEPGGLLTEMPMSIRPKMKKMIQEAESPKGAFLVGFLVTIFLLPCTIGPYLVLSGSLSFLNLIKTLPLLLIYNLVFISPMLAITLVSYAGLTRVDNVSEWRGRNIEKIHLIEGLIMVGIGTAMFFGFV